MTEENTKNWDIGSHLSFSKHITNTVQLGTKLGLTSMQFFLGGRTGYKRAAISQDDILNTQKILETNPASLFTHFPYTSNLVGSVGCKAWNGSEEQDTKTKALLTAIEYELGIMDNFDCTKGVVIHPGNFKKRDEGLKTIAKSINKISFNGKAKLILENAAGQGDSLAVSLEEIKTIIDNVDEKKRDNIGVCIDTCHIFASGEYDLRNVEDVDSLFTDFEKILGMNRFTLLHLNDSRTKLGSRVDRHDSLTQGLIWGKSTDSLVHLMNKCKEYKIPAVLETPDVPADLETLAVLSQE